MPEVEPGGGGGGGLTGIAVIVGNRRDLEVRSSTSALDVEVIQFETVGHGVYCERIVPYQSFLENSFAPLIAPVATAIEYALDHGFADAAAFAQDVGANGLIVNAIDFTVSVPGTLTQPGPFTTFVRVTVEDLFTSADWQTTINNTKAQLKAAAGL